MIVIYKFVGKNTAYELDLKENANCPESEKSGTGPGSCGGRDKNKNLPKDIETRKKGYEIAKTQLGLSDDEAVEYAIKYADSINKMKRENLSVKNRALKSAKQVGITDKNEIDAYVKKYIQSDRNAKRRKN